MSRARSARAGGYLAQVDFPDPVAALSDDDQLSLWVGRVAREHALLEYSLNNVFQVLCPAKDGSTPAGASQLAKACRDHLKATELGSEVKRAGEQALVGAQHANTNRNRLVHDIWLPSPEDGSGDGANWNIFGRPSPKDAPYATAARRDVRAVADVHVQMARARLRVSGLFMALHELLAPKARPKGVRSAEPRLPRYIALMEDRFVLEANGDFVITD